MADVMLYDRLVIPYPPSETERLRWMSEGWTPDSQERKIDILGDMAYPVKWDDWHQQQFNQRMNRNEVIGFDLNSMHNFARGKDPYMSTRMVLAEDALPALPDDVSKVWAMAAYPAMDMYIQDRSQSPQRTDLSLVISNHFFVPEERDMDDDQLLKKAVELASKDKVRMRREKLQQFQDDIIEEKISPEKAIRELEDLLKQYNKELKKSRMNMIYKYAFLAIEVGLGLAAGKLQDPIAISAAGAGILKFALLDRKPDINAGDCNAAALIHDFQNTFRV